MVPEKSSIIFKNFLLFSIIFSGPGGDAPGVLLDLTALDLQSRGDDGAGADPGDLGQAVSEAAALVGAEGNDGLAGQVVMLQEGEHAHRRSTAPAGEAHEDGIIAGNILQKSLPHFFYFYH